MSLSERHQRFKEAVDSLKLRFPGREIAERTGYNKATVSSYLSEREPSENFIKTFSEHFGVDYTWIWFGKSEMEPAGAPIAEPTPMQIVASLAEAFKAQAETARMQAEILKSIEAKMARAETQTKMDVSLADVQEKMTTVWRRQELGIEEFRDRLDRIEAAKAAPGGKARKTAHHNGGNV